MSNPETDDGATGRQPPTRPLVLPEKFDGTGNFEEWISHFESISAINNWNEEEKYQHSGCIKISADQYSALANVPSNIVFFCSACLLKLPNALMAFDKTNDMCSSIESKLESVERALSNRFDTLTTQVNDLSSKIYHGIQSMDTGMAAEIHLSEQESPDQSPLSVESIASMTASILSEDKEKEKRKLNLIIYNVSESTHTEAQDRKQDDIQRVTSLLAEYVGVTATVSNAICLGKKSENSEKSRLIKITVSSSEEKSAVPS